MENDVGVDNQVEEIDVEQEGAEQPGGATATKDPLEKAAKEFNLQTALGEVVFIDEEDEGNRRRKVQRAPCP